MLVVRAASTTGHRRNEALMIAALRGLGLEVAEARPDYGLIAPLRRAEPFIDLAEAAAMSAATGRVLRTLRARSIIYPTSLSAIFEPASRLQTGVVRFDALAAENRPARRNLLQRRLEKRSLALARVLAPASLLSSRACLGERAEATIVALPPPVDAGGHPSGSRQPTAVCYAGDAHKKGLDVIVQAWHGARPPAGHRLVVTGIGEVEGRRFLRRRGIPEPQGISWLGSIPAERFRSLSAGAEVYLAAARYEDFGMAPLEALADGALLVTVPSPGPFEALSLARRLEPDLVASSFSADALAVALRRAWAMTPAERQAYRVGARRLVGPYSRASLAERLRTQLLPVLLGGV